MSTLIVQFVTEDQIPVKPAAKGRPFGTTSSRWNEVVKILESHPTTTGAFIIATFPYADEQGNKLLTKAGKVKAFGDANNVVIHFTSKAPNHKRLYVAVRNSRHTFEAFARLWKDPRDPENVKLWEYRVYARALPLEVGPITMPELGSD
jgi:hypothetical protein